MSAADELVAVAQGRAAARAGQTPAPVVPSPERGTFRGQWTAGVYYERNDVVAQDGVELAAIVGHLAAATFAADAAKWVDVPGGPGVELAFAETTEWQMVTGQGNAEDVVVITFAPPTDRPYGVHFHLPFLFCDTAGQDAIAAILDTDGVVLSQTITRLDVANSGLPTDVYARRPPAASSAPITLRGAIMGAGAGTVNAYASTGVGGEYRPFIEALRR